MWADYNKELLMYIFRFQSINEIFFWTPDIYTRIYKIHVIVDNKQQLGIPTVNYDNISLPSL